MLGGGAGRTGAGRGGAAGGVFGAGDGKLGDPGVFGSGDCIGGAPGVLGAGLGIFGAGPGTAGGVCAYIVATIIQPIISFITPLKPSREPCLRQL
jgi:hypothetical protein